MIKRKKTDHSIIVRSNKSLFLFRSITFCLLTSLFTYIAPKAYGQGQVQINTLALWQGHVSIDYNNCTGALDVTFPLSSGAFGAGNGNDGWRLKVVDIYIKRPNVDREYLTSVYRVRDDADNLNFTPGAHVPSTTFVRSIPNQTDYKYSIRNIAPFPDGTPYAAVSSFTGDDTQGFTLGTLVFNDLPDAYLNQEVEIHFDNGSWNRGTSDQLGFNILENEFNQSPLTQGVPMIPTLMATSRCDGVE